MKKLVVLVCILGFTLFADCTFGAPAITSPTPGTKLTDTTVTFSWDADGYTYFQFYGGDNIAPYQSDTITDTSITLAGFPNDGSPIFVRLSYWDGTEWIKTTYFYQSTGSGARLPSISSPTPGSDITNQSQTFQLDFGDYKVDTWLSFYFNIGSVPFGADIFESGVTADDTITINNLPRDNSTLHVTLGYWDGLEFQNIEYTYLGKTFPWAMFLPAFTTPHECGLDYLGLCSDQMSCEAVGAYWWSKRCNENMSENQAYMARLAGYVTFHYVMLGIEWTEHYYFDIKTLREMDSENGYFWISGIDDYGYTVDAREYAIGGSYYFVNEGFPTVDERFQFWIDASRSISGNFKVKYKDIGWSDVSSTDLYGTHSKTSFPP